MTSLRLNDNKLKFLPLCLAAYPSLTSLAVDAAVVEEPSPPVLARGVGATLAYVTALSKAVDRGALALVGCGATSFNLSFYALDAVLSAVDLSRNELTDFPPCILELTRLTALSLAENRISRAAPVGPLSRLRRINLSRNLLPSLPPEVETLQFLSTLDVSHNSIADPPTGVDFPSLRILRLEGNKITNVALFCGTRLVEADFGANSVASLPSAASLSTVAILRLANNLFPLSSPSNKQKARPFSRRRVRPAARRVAGPGV